MILNHTYKYVFIRSKKTASTSIEKYLSHTLYGSDLQNHNNPEDADPFYNHMTAIEFIEECAALWRYYFTFSIIRHPLDRLISEYFYSNRYNDYTNFSEFIRSNHVHGTLNCDVLNTKTYVPFNYIIRYENLIPDFITVLQYLKIDVNIHLLPNEKSEYRKDRRPWQEYISKEDLIYIKNNFKKELDFHTQYGYTY